MDYAYKIGDIVRASPLSHPADREEFRYGIVLDFYEQEDGSVYYEVQWSTERSWWREDELRIISES